jgi:hypothetical protein
MEAMSDRSESLALCIRDPGIVPYAERGSTFHRHCRTHGVLALTTTSLGMFAPLVCGALGFLTLGLGWGLLAVSVSTLAAVSIVNISALLGNAKLEARLREQIGARASEMEFVGLCRSENNTLRGKYLTPRLDTDDNVGFLELTDSTLRIATEESTVVIARSSIQTIDSVRCIELPYLSWIQIEFEDEDDHIGSFLLMSRQASTIREIRSRTRALYATLIDWHTEAQLRWLEEHRD